MDKWDKGSLNSERYTSEAKGIAKQIDILRRINTDSIKR